MRLELTFKIENLELPVDNSKIWISFLKNCLSKCHKGQFFERYFGGHQIKDYTYTIILPSPKYDGDKIILGNDQVKMLFSADDKNKTGLIFYQAFIGVKQKRFPLPEGNGIVLKQITQKKEQLIVSSKVIFRTVVGGGLVVRDHNKETNRDKFLTFQDEKFNDGLCQVLETQAKEAGFAVGTGKNVCFKPIECKKILVKHFSIYVDTTIGFFQLEGDPDFLQYLYQAGMGSKHSAGFGFIDLIAQEN